MIICLTRPSLAFLHSSRSFIQLSREHLAKHHSHSPAFIPISWLPIHLDDTIYHLPITPLQRSRAATASSLQRRRGGIVSPQRGRAAIVSPQRGRATIAADLCVIGSRQQSRHRCCRGPMTAAPLWTSSSVSGAAQTLSARGRIARA